MNQSRPEIAVETSTRPSDKVPGFLSDFAYRDGLKERDTDIHIAIMGQTGAGKSTFISLLADPDQTVETSESLKSCRCPILARTTLADIYVSRLYIQAV